MTYSHTHSTTGHVSDDYLISAPLFHAYSLKTCTLVSPLFGSHATSAWITIAKLLTIEMYFQVFTLLFNTHLHKPQPEAFFRKKFYMQGSVQCLSTERSSSQRSDTGSCQKQTFFLFFTWDTVNKNSSSAGSVTTGKQHCGRGTVMFTQWLVRSSAPPIFVPTYPLARYWTPNVC